MISFHQGRLKTWWSHPKVSQHLVTSCWERADRPSPKGYLLFILWVVPGLNNSVLALTINNLVSAVCVWLLKTSWLETLKKREGEVNALSWELSFELLKSCQKMKTCPRGIRIMGIKTSGWFSYQFFGSQFNEVFYQRQEFADSLPQILPGRRHPIPSARTITILRFQIERGLCRCCYLYLPFDNQCLERF